jgi:hypothetical protein
MGRTCSTLTSPAEDGQALPRHRPRVAHRDIANLAQCVQRGGNLNHSERAFLRGMAVTDGQTRTAAGNYVKLAQHLGCARRTMHRWRKHKNAPAPVANGFHEVSAWQEFRRRHDLKSDAVATDEENALRARKLPTEVWGGAETAPGGEEGQLREH